MSYINFSRLDNLKKQVFDLEKRYNLKKHVLVVKCMTSLMEPCDTSSVIQTAENF